MTLAKRLAREPLAHFLALGAGLFVLFGAVDDSGDSRPDRIVVSAAQVEMLAEAWMRTWQRPPTPRELEGLVQDHIREEVYYREALAMGLDRDDTIVRRRMRQKLEFLADDLTAAVEPTEEQLRDYLDEHADAYRFPNRVSLDHVYLNRDRRGEAASRDAERLLARLQAAGPEVDAAMLGDPLLLPREFELVTEDEVASRFGRRFSEAVAALPIGRWAGPVESGYGLHLVLVQERKAGEAPTLETVRDAVERDWRAARRAEATEAFYQGLRERYSVVVERPEVAGAGTQSPDVAAASR